MSVKVIDRGYNKVVRNLTKAARNRPVMTIGIHGDAGGGYPSGATAAQVGGYHEFGEGHNPQRSWLDGWVKEHEDDINRAMRAQAEQVVKGNLTKEQAYDRLGILFVASIQRRMAGGIGPAKVDGSPATLIDTGQMRSGIKHKLE